MCGGLYRWWAVMRGWVILLNILQNFYTIWLKWIKRPAWYRSIKPFHNSPKSWRPICHTCQRTPPQMASQRTTTATQRAAPPPMRTTVCMRASASTSLNWILTLASKEPFFMKTAEPLLHFRKRFHFLSYMQQKHVTFCILVWRAGRQTVVIYVKNCSSQTVGVARVPSLNPRLNTNWW